MATQVLPSLLAQLTFPATALLGIGSLAVLLAGIVGLVWTFLGTNQRNFTPQFSLSTIFALITSFCLFLGVVVAFGPDVIFVLIYTLPWFNLVAIAITVTCLVRSTGESRATHIGRLVPLLALAVELHPIAESIEEMAVVNFVVAYVTAWVSGFVCRRVWRRETL